MAFLLFSLKTAHPLGRMTAEVAEETGDDGVAGIFEHLCLDCDEHTRGEKPPVGEQQVGGQPLGSGIIKREPALCVASHQRGTDEPLRLVVRGGERTAIVLQLMLIHEAPGLVEVGAVFRVQSKVPAFIEGVVLKGEQLKESVTMQRLPEQGEDRLLAQMEIHKEEGGGKITEPQERLDIETGGRVKDRLTEDLWGDLMIEQRRRFPQMSAHVSIFGVGWKAQASPANRDPNRPDHPPACDRVPRYAVVLPAEQDQALQESNLEKYELA